MPYNCSMLDKEHEEWLENRNARKAAAKKSGSKPPLPLKKPTDTKKAELDDDHEGLIWRGEA